MNPGAICPPASGWPEVVTLIAVLAFFAFLAWLGVRMFR